jgi:hypothetical protein
VACEPVVLVVGGLFGGWVGAFSTFIGREIVLARRAEKQLRAEKAANSGENVSAPGAGGRKLE